ncbi:hypothetical protein RFI_17323 [Reticulomyxa filosa]|uniref:Uncharacterized protein n=1 Tax=Reticulomyxa filosa TaxID=46433 RepID=X6N1Z5_RETFI|nr:hypothetical protein RFI_17323 [Reticulomyxa filosa]|eukprot:ETO19893.1 hypothetical protein RFI_17323 [Reticulomyxa filosa]
MERFIMPVFSDERNRISSSSKSETNIKNNDHSEQLNHSFSIGTAGNGMTVESASADWRSTNKDKSKRQVENIAGVVDANGTKDDNNNNNNKETKQGIRVEERQYNTVQGLSVESRQNDNTVVNATDNERKSEQEQEREVSKEKGEERKGEEEKETETETETDQDKDKDKDKDKEKEEEGGNTKLSSYKTNNNSAIDDEMVKKDENKEENIMDEGAKDTPHKTYTIQELEEAMKIDLVPKLKGSGTSSLHPHSNNGFEKKHDATDGKEDKYINRDHERKENQNQQDNKSDSSQEGSVSFVSWLGKKIRRSETEKNTSASKREETAKKSNSNNNNNNDMTPKEQLLFGNWLTLYDDKDGRTQLLRSETLSEKSKKRKSL